MINNQSKILLESTMICSKERKRFDFLASVDTKSLSLHMLRLCWQRSTYSKQGPVTRSLVSANRCLRGIKTDRFPRYLTLASAIHASSNPGQRDFSKPKKRRYTISAQVADEINLKKKIDIPKHHLPFCSIYPRLIKSLSIPRFGFNIWAEFKLCFANQSSTNAKRWLIFRAISF